MRRKANPPRRRRRTRRGMRLFNMAVPPVRDLVAASGGMVLSKTAPAFLQRFIPLPMTGIAGLATRAAVSLLAGSLASRFAGRRTGEMVTFGGMLAVADDALSMFVYPQLFGMAPTTGADGRLPARRRRRRQHGGAIPFAGRERAHDGLEHRDGIATRRQRTPVTNRRGAPHV